MRSVAVAPTDPFRSLPGLRQRAARVAEALYALETDAEYALIKDTSPFAGQSATLATDARSRIDNLWLRYPLLTDAIDRLEAATTDDNRTERQRLLGRSAVALPDGATTSIDGLLTAIERDLAEATAAARRLGEAWRSLLPRIDRLAADHKQLTAHATELGLTHDRYLATAGRLTDHLAAHAASDPLGVDAHPAEQAMERARQRIEGLAAARASLPDDLGAAHRLLDDLSGLIVEGGDVLETTRAKVERPQGLLRPIDPAVIDGDQRALRPWLDRLEELASKGDWKSAVAGLRRWRTVADGWLANARRVVDANRAPVRRRDDLRGLLASYHAKAAAAGLAEDAAVTELYQVARAALHVGRCDLGAAERHVGRYRNGVNRAAGSTAS